MKRFSEAVLNGHPDKFCDLIADRIIRHLYQTASDVYAQIEVSTWSDYIFLTGCAITRSKVNLNVRDIIVELGYEIGYTPRNHINVEQYQIQDHLCRITGDPDDWNNFSNDQSIITAYAGYDDKTRFLPPEHFLVWYLRESLIRSFHGGLLQNQGPDGKLLVIIQEDAEGWRPEKILVTLQQEPSISFIDFTINLNRVLREAWDLLRTHDKRWKGLWNDIRVIINPNGPLINGGSDGDNGQTGRKLVMDYYGPRIALGGGAIYGKNLAHIDRLGAFNARRYAIDLVRYGSKEAIVELCYAPGMKSPLSVQIKAEKRHPAPADQYFDFGEMRKKLDASVLDYDLIGLGTFYNNGLSFNHGTETLKIPVRDSISGQQ